MIHTITIEGGFAHKNATFDFHAGMTGITGVNASGKSEIITSIRFALFGTPALRTEASDYKGYKVRMEFSVKGVRYGVERSTTQAKLMRSGEVIATGVRPVNGKVIDILGYGLDVFDVANVANQGLIEALSSMRPSERKRMVDQTVGLDVLDGLVAFCTTQAREATTKATTLRGVAREPTVPVPPQGVTDLALLEQERSALHDLDFERRDLERSLAQEPPPPGAEPSCDVVELVEELMNQLQRKQSAQAELDRLVRERKSLPEVVTVEEIEAGEAAWEAFQQWSAARQLIQTYPEPDLTTAQLDEIEAALDLREDYDEYQRLAKAGHNECPACLHRWPFNHLKMGHLRAWEGQDAPAVPALTRKELAVQRKRRATYDAQGDLLAAARNVPAAAEPKIPQATLKAARETLTNNARREALDTRIGELGEAVEGIVALRKDIETRRAYDRARTAWLKESAAYAAYQTEAPGWRARVEQIGETTSRLEALSSHIVAVKVYDKELAAYEAARATYDAVVEQIAEADRVTADYVAAKGALVELKAKVKSFLVPSLARVASQLVSSMTGGALTRIEIDDDFDILVDGKKIEGMSGAEKAAVNIALRIGLGRVLTHKVFSVFMADEIDAAMDTDRAQYTASSLRNLSQSIAQIVLVSHKEPVVDHYIRL